MYTFISLIFIVILEFFPDLLVINTGAQKQTKIERQPQVDGPEYGSTTPETLITFSIYLFT